MSWAVIWARSWVALSKMVTRSVPLNWTLELLLKLVPVTVNSKAASPAPLLVGRMLVSVGSGLFTVSVLGLELPPPGRGLNTGIASVLADWRSVAGICARNSVLLITVVGRLLLLHCTTELLLKLVPITVNSNAGSPTTLLVGGLGESVGAGVL